MKMVSCEAAARTSAGEIGVLPTVVAGSRLNPQPERPITARVNRARASRRRRRDASTIVTPASVSSGLTPRSP